MNLWWGGEIFYNKTNSDAGANVDFTTRKKIVYSFLQKRMYSKADLDAAAALLYILVCKKEKCL